MDSDLYVPISLIASFKRVREWTTDMDLIVKTLKESPAVTVDESGTKVKPNISLERSTVILRDVPDCTEEVNQQITEIVSITTLTCIIPGNQGIFEEYRCTSCSVYEKRYWKFMVFHI